MGKNLNHSTVAWLFFDSGLSAYSTIILTLVFAPYFSQKIANNPIIGAAYWGYAIALAGFISGISGLFIAAAADLQGRIKPWLSFSILLVIGSAALLWFSYPNSGSILWTLTCISIGSIGVAFSTIFYNTMLGFLVEKQYLGRVSAWGRGFGYLGSVGCLLIALFFVNSTIFTSMMPSEAGVRACGPFVALWTIVFTLPLFLFCPDKTTNKLTILYSVKQSLFTFIITLKSLFREQQNIGILICATLLFLDGLNISSALGGIYLAHIYHLSIANIVIFGIIFAIVAGIGTICLGWFVDYFGAKRILITILSMMSILFLLMIFSKTFLLFAIAATMNALLVGTAFSASRALIVQLAPLHQLAEILSLCAFSERITAFLGPTLPSSIILATNSQRMGMLVVPLFLLIGTLLVSRV